MNRKVKLSISVIGGILLFLLILGITSSFFLEDYLKKELVKEFFAQSKGEYKLTLSNIELSIWNRAVSAHQITIVPTTEEKEVQQLTAQSIQLSGIQWLSLIDQPFPAFKAVTVHRPIASLLSRPISPSESETDSSNNDFELSIFDVHILNGAAIIKKEDGAKIFSLDNFNMKARQVNLNMVLKGSYVPYLEELTFTGSQLSWMLEQQLYELSIEQFEFSKRKQKAQITNLQLNPLAPKYRFSELKGRQLDRFDVIIPSLSFTGLNLNRITQNILSIDSLIIENATLDVFHDKHMPPAHGKKLKPLLNKVAREIELTASLNHTVVSNTDIIYGEHLPQSNKAGYISFNKLNATIDNFRTSSHPRFGQDTLSMHTETMFMDSSPLTVDLRYHVFDEMETHFIEATLEDLDAAKANVMLENTAFIKVKEGYLNRMHLNMKLDREKATGIIKLDYKNLKIQVLKKDKSKSQNIRSRLSTFVANNLVIKSDNTGTDLRQGEIDFEREPDKGIFGYWWKSTLSGIKSSIK
ncbi:MAG: hypothetical protein FH748_09530 [Balneolaceae bacterium]|nr:hypothetical protein [Balneolaceae bacterium]